MANSAQLSEIHNSGNHRHRSNDQTKKSDKQMKLVGKKVYERLKTFYPELTFKYKTQIFSKDIIEHLRDKNYYTNEHQPTLLGKCKKTNARPDGGALFVVDNKGIERLIIVGEAKAQQYNMGNAIERVGKNLEMFRNLTEGEDYFPYFVYICGGIVRMETILQRVAEFNYSLPMNKIHNIKEKEHHKKSPGMRMFTIWTKEEFDQLLCYDIMLDIAIASLNHLKEQEAI